MMSELAAKILRERNMTFATSPHEPPTPFYSQNEIALAEQLTAANARVAELTTERDTAIRMLAEWCVMVQINGSGWDDWDEAYKDAAYRPCGIRELIDDAIDKEKARWKEEYGRE